MVLLAGHHYHCPVLHVVGEKKKREDTSVTMLDA